MTNRPLPVSRLRELARQAAEFIHKNTVQDERHWRDTETGVKWPFDSCPHPDCVLVREPAIEAALRADTEGPARFRCPNCGIDTDTAPRPERHGYGCVHDGDDITALRPDDCTCPEWKYAGAALEGRQEQKS